MWRRSNRFSKSIVVLFFVSLLVASPCFARASWAAFFSTNENTTTSAVVSQALENPLPQDSYQVDSMAQSETRKTNSSKVLQEQLNALEKELIALEKESQDLEISWEKLTEQLKAYKDTKKISQEVYDTLMVLAETALDKTEVYEGFIVKQSETIADQDVELAKLKRKAGFKQFFKLNGLVGFDAGIPTWSAGLGYGFKFGNGLVFEVGANYEVGNLLKPIDFTETFSLDKLTASVSVGVLF